MPFDLNQMLFSGTAGGIISGLATTMAFLVLVGVLGGLFYIWKFKVNYDIKVRIYSKRYGTWKTWDDAGAIMKYKKTGEAYGFKLKHEKDLLEPPPFDIMLPSLAGKNVLHLMQLSAGEWFYLKTCLDDPLGDEKLKIFKLRVIEGDVQLWTCTMIDKIYTMYQKQNWLEKYWPIIAISVTGMFVLLIIYFLLQKFDVLSATSANLADAANALREFKQSGQMLPSGV